MYLLILQQLSDVLRVSSLVVGELMLVVTVCQPSFVDSISAAQKLRGCTIIQGGLEIEIRGGSELLLTMSGCVSGCDGDCVWNK